MVENGARCSDYNIKMDWLIKIDEKTSVNNIIHVRNIRSLTETCMLCKSSASENSDGIRH